MIQLSSINSMKVSDFPRHNYLFPAVFHILFLLFPFFPVVLPTCSCSHPPPPPCFMCIPVNLNHYSRCKLLKSLLLSYSSPYGSLLHIHLHVVLCFSCDPAYHHSLPFHTYWLCHLEPHLVINKLSCILNHFSHVLLLLPFLKALSFLKILFTLQPSDVDPIHSPIVPCHVLQVG